MYETHTITYCSVADLGSIAIADKRALKIIVDDPRYIPVRTTCRVGERLTTGENTIPPISVKLNCQLPQEQPSLYDASPKFRHFSRPAPLAGATG